MAKGKPSRRELRRFSKSKLVGAVQDSERDLLLTIAWRRMKNRRFFLLGMLTGAALAALAHAFTI